MKKLYLILVLLAVAAAAGAADTIRVAMPDVPILIGQADNVLFNIRVDATQGERLRGVTVEFLQGSDIGSVESVKLYYCGTEGVARKGFHYSAYSDATLIRNLSYSTLQAAAVAKLGKVVLACDTKLWRGVNYFWVSVQMKRSTMVDSRIGARVCSVTIDDKESEPVFRDGTAWRRMGVSVRNGGDDGVNAFRIPGLVTSKKGTLIGVYDIRYNSSGDLQEHIDVGVSRSTDGGQSWEKMITAISMGEYGGLPRAQNGVGDPAILVDDVTGTIWIVAAWTHGMGRQHAWFNSQSGMDEQHTAQLLLARSDDDGKTWSSPINITQTVKQPSWRFLLQGPGRGITMQDGTLVFATQYIDSLGVPNAGLMYSVDRGKSWNIHNLARTNTTEAQVAELERGVLMLNMRDNRGGSRAVATTRDMGRTWSEHPSSRSVLQESVCMASLIAVKAADNVLGRDLLLFSNPNTTKGRHSITIKGSDDGGLTFPYSVMLDSGSGWGYSCLTMVDDQTVGILYESSVAHMTFQRVKITDIFK